MVERFEGSGAREKFGPGKFYNTIEKDDQGRALY
jgi:hypothetical protein